MKVCSSCKQEKDRDEFHKNKSGTLGLASRCKGCTKVYAKENKERIAAKNKAWNEANKAHVLRYKREQYADPNSRVRQYSEGYKNTPAGRLSTYKTSAKAAGRVFELTLEDINTLWQKPCTYCGEIVDTVGVDRVDSTKGYTLDNVTSCCTTCNLMKRHHTVDDFKNHIIKLYQHLTN
jgi:hypothetical protein